MHPFKLKISDAGRTEETEGENLGDVALCMWQTQISQQKRFQNKSCICVISEGSQRYNQI